MAYEYAIVSDSEDGSLLVHEKGFPTAEAAAEVAVWTYRNGSVRIAQRKLLPWMTLATSDRKLEESEEERQECFHIAERNGNQPS